jgi:hypothetical protein
MTTRNVPAQDLEPGQRILCDGIYRLITGVWTNGADVKVSFERTVRVYTYRWGDPVAILAVPSRIH